MIRAMMASSLQGVVAQTLLRRADGSGRIGAFEILVGTNAVRNLIRENQIPQMYSMMQTGSRYGMVTMDEAITNLLEGGIIDKGEARRALIKTSDDDDERDEDYASGAMGGAKLTGDDYGSSGGSGSKGGEGYSF